MSKLGLRRSLKGYVRDSHRRKMVLNVDLNLTPPPEGRSVTRSQEAQTSVQGGALRRGEIIDLDAIDDEVMISSPRSFAEARNRSRRNQDVAVVLNEQSDINQGNSADPNNGLAFNGQHKRRQISSSHAIINYEVHKNLDSNTNAENEVKPPEPPVSPPKEPSFCCPVCIGDLNEAMSTKCGHIFCKNCIMIAISTQHKCPTCRRRLTLKDMIRVYLPSLS